MNATTRAADVLLRAMGGRRVLLRMPAPAVPADPTEQLGLATPQFQDLPLAPCVSRKARATVTLGATVTAGAPSKFSLGGSGGSNGSIKSELLVSASAVERIVGSLAYASASVLFANAVGILAGPARDSDASTDSDLLEIVSASAEEAFGQPYVYRLVLRAPQMQIV
jgi:hypothetical protein